MSTVLIRQALEGHLATLTPVIATVYENKDYVTVTGLPYQRTNILEAQPDNIVMGQSFYQELGIFQVTLFYPQNQTALPAQTRAELVRTLFRRGTSILKDGLSVNIRFTPKVGSGYIDESRYCIPISIYYQCDINL